VFDLMCELSVVSRAPPCCWRDRWHHGMYNGSMPQKTVKLVARDDATSPRLKLEDTPKIQKDDNRQNVY